MATDVTDSTFEQEVIHATTVRAHDNAILDW